MIDHLTIRVTDFERSKAFYLAALAPLGWKLHMEFDMPEYGKFCGIGPEEKPELWLAVANKEHILPFGMHVAIAAKRHADVDAFHAAALAAGAKDDGAPGPRPMYHPNYYGGFVIDPDGVRLEACCHHAE